MTRLKKQESEGIIEEPSEKFKTAGTVHYLPHHPVTNQLLLSVLFTMHLLKRMVSL